MTFADWYNANIVPQLEENLKLYPVTAREAVRTASRLAMAACWNAALDSACGLRQPHWNREEVTEMLEEFRA